MTLTEKITFVLVILTMYSNFIHPSKAHGVQWSSRPDTGSNANSYTICTPHSSETSPDKKSGQSEEKDQKKKGNNASKSHNLKSEKPSNQLSTDTNTDSSCSLLQLDRQHKFTSNIEDFRIGKDTSFTQIVTADTFLTFDGSTPKQSVALDTNVEVYLNQGSSSSTALCRDLTEGLAEKDQKSLDCRFFDSDGDTIRRKYFYNNAGGRRLFDTGFLVSEGGKLRFYNYRDDSTVWKDDRILDQVFFSPDSRYLLVSFTGLSGTTNELRRLRTGETINSGGDLISTQGVDSSGDFIYQVSPDPGSRTRRITIYNRNFEKLYSVKKLPFENRYHGRFDVKQNRLWIPRDDGYLFTANVHEQSNDTFPYPYSNFTPEAFDLNLSSAQDHLFAYGFRGSRPPGSITSKNYDRYLLIFNLNRQQFSSVIYRFSKKKHDFDNLHKPNIRVVPSGLLAVQHPKTLGIYRIDFRSH